MSKKVKEFSSPYKGTEKFKSYSGQMLATIEIVYGHAWSNGVLATKFSAQEEKDRYPLVVVGPMSRLDS